jgi:hypothetical protein
VNHNLFERTLPGKRLWDFGTKTDLGARSGLKIFSNIRVVDRNQKTICSLVLFRLDVGLKDHGTVI